MHLMHLMHLKHLKHLASCIALGIIFIQQVYGSLAMPDFNSTLHALLGISSGTYLGLKAESALR